MPAKDALRLCPDLIFDPRNPDLYRSAPYALLFEIKAAVPIDTANSAPRWFVTSVPKAMQIRAYNLWTYPAAKIYI